MVVHESESVLAVLSGRYDAVKATTTYTKGQWREETASLISG